MVGKSQIQKFIKKLEDARQATQRMSEVAAEREQILAARLLDAQQVAMRTTQTGAERERSLLAKLHEAQQTAAERERELLIRISDVQFQLAEARTAIGREQKLAESHRHQAVTKANLIYERLDALQNSFEMIAPSGLGPWSLVPRDGNFRIADFEVLQGEKFVRAAYQALLGREPDHGGFEYYRRRLGQGISRIQILGEIRNSEEGRAAGVKIPGLALRYTLRKVANVPILGVIFRLLLGISYISHLERNQAAMNNHLVQLAEQNDRVFSGYLDAVSYTINELKAASIEITHNETVFDDQDLSSGRSSVAGTKVEESSSDT